MQDLISRLLERKPTRRLGMLNGRATDIKRHKWFDGLDWDALEARKMEPPRLPKDDSAKRLRELTVSSPLRRVIPWPALSHMIEACKAAKVDTPHVLISVSAISCLGSKMANVDYRTFCIGFGRSSPSHALGILNVSHSNSYAGQ